MEKQGFSNLASSNIEYNSESRRRARSFTLSSDGANAECVQRNEVYNSLSSKMGVNLR